MVRPHVRLPDSQYYSGHLILCVYDDNVASLLVTSLVVHVTFRVMYVTFCSLCVMKDTSAVLGTDIQSLTNGSA